jgi:guanine nucleotide-binding protein G(i) subunit alpha
MNAMLAAYEKLKVSMPGAVKSIQDKLAADADWGEDKLNESIGKMVEELWADASMKEIFKRRSEFQLNDSAEYYFNEVTRLAAADYQPTEQDVLRSRVRTTGIVQSEFAIKGEPFDCLPTWYFVDHTLTSCCRVMAPYRSRFRDV